MNVRVEFQTRRSELVLAALKGIFPAFDNAPVLHDFLQHAVNNTTNLAIAKSLATACAETAQFAINGDCLHVTRTTPPGAGICFAYNQEPRAWEIIFLAHRSEQGELVAPLENMKEIASDGLVVVFQDEEMPISDVLGKLQGSLAEA